MRKMIEGKWGVKENDKKGDGEVIDRDERGNGRKIRRNQNKSWKN